MTNCVRLDSCNLPMFRPGFRDVVRFDIFHYSAGEEYWLSLGMGNKSHYMSGNWEDGEWVEIDIWT